jgi:hypothetical protein
VDKNNGILVYKMVFSNKIFEKAAKRLMEIEGKKLCGIQYVVKGGKYSRMIVDENLIIKKLMNENYIGNGYEIGNKFKFIRSDEIVALRVRSLDKDDINSEWFSGEEEVIILYSYDMERLFVRNCVDIPTIYIKGCMNETIVDKNKNLISFGLWITCEIVYEEEIDRKIIECKNFCETTKKDMIKMMKLLNVTMDNINVMIIDKKKEIENYECDDMVKKIITYGLGRLLSFVK